MKLSEFINKLAEFKNEWGDKDVWFCINYQMTDDIAIGKWLSNNVLISDTNPDSVRLTEVKNSIDKILDHLIYEETNKEKKIGQSKECNS